jgi:DNA-directed RNA polymerase subunit RPC12/RpoP
MANFQCFACQKVSIMVAEDTDACPTCGSKNGEVISNERLKEGMKAGAIWNIDPRTGKRAKPKKR